MFEFEENSLSIGLDYLPKEVQTKVNKNICNGGGGGGGTTTTELDPDVKAAVLPAIKQAGRDYLGGEYSKTADQTGLKGALSQQQQVSQKIVDEGLGRESMLRQLDNEQGRILSAQQGALGSARADRARQAALLDKEMQLNQADIAARQQAAGLISDVQKKNLDLDQFKEDANIRGTERFFGALSGAPQGSKTTQTGGK